MVMTAEPFAAAASTVQDLTATPSIWTTQAPHCDVSQPTCVPGQAELVAQETHEERSVLDIAGLRLSVHGDGNIRHRHPPFGAARSPAVLHRKRPDDNSTRMTRRPQTIGPAEKPHGSLRLDLLLDFASRRPRHPPPAAFGRVGPSRQRRSTQAIAPPPAGLLGEGTRRTRRPSFLAVESIRREPSCASLPPTCALTA